MLDPYLGKYIDNHQNDQIHINLFFINVYRVYRRKTGGSSYEIIERNVIIRG
jgi:hypothetical protein